MYQRTKTITDSLTRLMVTLYPQATETADLQKAVNEHRGALFRLERAAPLFVLSGAEAEEQAEKLRADVVATRAVELQAIHKALTFIMADCKQETAGLPALI